MVDNIMIVAALCIVAAILCRLLDKYNKEQAVMLSIAACAAVLGFVVIYISPVINMISDLYSMCEMDEDYSLIIFKSLGICYITQFACDVCRDCGENAIGTVTEIAGKTALVILALPLFENLIEYINKLSQ